MTIHPPRSDGRITLCGSGGASDCVALRLVPRPANAENQDGPEQYIEYSDSEDLSAGRFALEPHELYQLAYGVLAGRMPADIAAAVQADMDAHPELPRIPAAAFTAVQTEELARVAAR